MRKPTIKHTIQGIQFKFPYNKFAINSIKKIPANLRRWEPNSKCWIVASSQEPELIRICQFHFNNEYDVIGSPKKANAVETKLLKVKYIGQPKDRGDGQNTAFACDFANNWNVVFSEDVLKNWFECGIGGVDNQKPLPGIVVSHYALLAIGKSATGIEIKKAYRKAVRRYHPDVNHDDDAAEMFIKIQSAYETLKNPLSRRRYDASLLFEADVSKPSQNANAWLRAHAGAYRPPQRCGWIMCEGKNEVGRFVVSKIMKWEIITNNTGQELVTSWDSVAKEIKQEWI